MFSRRHALLQITRQVEENIRLFCDRRFKETVRVRFAPSPTGYLHLGGLRTALYNYLFAKRYGGMFILRIEDTDQSRLVEGAVEQLEEDLAWAGIEADESPSKGGPCGPYKQSERLLFYREYARNLVDSGAAYPCFCTPRRLELLRREATRTRQVPRYDNRCREFAAVEAQARIDHGESHCIRLKLGPVEGWTDVVLGSVNPDLSTEGDPVLLKTDGFPTYHLANVVDDHLMGVNHVLRGAEWQVSTPKHLLIYRALGWEPPVFAHLPLLLNADGTKLSKRQSDATVAQQRAAGTLPRALLTWLAQAGGGGLGLADHAAGSSDRQLQLLPPPRQLAERFDLARVSRASCRLPPDLLPALNQLELRERLQLPETARQLARQLQGMLEQSYGRRPDSGAARLGEDEVLSVLRWAAAERIHRLPELLDPELAFLWEPPAPGAAAAAAGPGTGPALREVRAALARLPPDSFERDPLAAELRAAARRLSLPFPRLMHVTRAALSGRKEGPAVAEMLAVLGPESALARLDAAAAAATEDEAAV